MKPYSHFDATHDRNLIRIRPIDVGHMALQTPGRKRSETCKWRNGHGPATTCPLEVFHGGDDIGC